MTTKADAIRRYVFETYIVTARKKHATQVTVVSGEVGKALGMKQLMPAVCGALGANKFQNEYKVKLVGISGPLHGATTTFTFEV